MAYTEPNIPGPIAATNTPGFAVPPGACDCHAHVFGPQSRYEYDPKRRYTPPDALVTDYIRMLKALGFSRGILVQASVYMTDNTALIDALEETKDFELRGVAAVDSVTDAELERMHAAGVRGVRVNLRVENGTSADAAPALARRIAPLGWHLNLRAMPKDFDDVRRLLDVVPVDIVIDHIGAVPVALGTQGSDFRKLLGLVGTGRVYVKLCGPMRISAQEYPYADVTPLVQDLVAAAPDRMVFATDWPHTGVTGAMPNDGDLGDLLAIWAPDAATRKKILVDNPAKIYGF